MVSRAAVDQYRRASNRVSDAAQKALQVIFSTLDLSNPSAARDELLDFLPTLVREYGQASASLAADWFESLDGGRLVLAKPPETIRVEQKVRYLAGQLWTPQPQEILGSLKIATDKYVKQAGRDTITRSSERSKTRWARVPTGARTCAFCLTLASRDAVYLSKKSAVQGKDGNRYHGFCDCVPVPLNSWDDYPEGYDPQELYRIYQIAADRAGTTSNIKDVAAAMRREFPSMVTDSVA